MIRINALLLTLGMAALLCISMYAQEKTSYNFETIKYSGDTFTQALGINNSRRIAGYHGATVNRGFTLDLSSKTFTNENFPDSAQTQVIAINDNSDTAGFYIDAAGSTHGFTYRRGNFLKVDYPGTPCNQLLGQNDSTRPSATTAQRQTGPVAIMPTSMTRMAQFSSCSKFPVPPARRLQGSIIPGMLAGFSWIPKE